jgi:hypothetical protein
MVSTSQKGQQYERAGNDPAIKCFGSRIVVTQPITLEGTKYPRGALLTVDKDNNWVLIRSWD